MFKKILYLCLMIASLFSILSILFLTSCEQFGNIPSGEYKLSLTKSENYDLNQEVSNDQIDKEKIVYMNLKAGEISLHSDALLHGSDANHSNNPRCGITLRYSPSNVKADLSEWPFFSVQIARGETNHSLNPIAPMPRGEATPVKGFQFHHEFESEW